jgi:hypothetical protein
MAKAARLVRAGDDEVLVPEDTIEPRAGTSPKRSYMRQFIRGHIPHRYLRACIRLEYLPEKTVTNTK